MARGACRAGHNRATDLVSVGDPETTAPLELPRSTLLRREIFTKKSGGGLSVRKVVAWKTNKDQIDPLYPSYVFYFTDFAYARKVPLKTDVRVASTPEKINALADSWIAENITDGWKPHGVTALESPQLPKVCRQGSTFKLDLEISFGRTASVNFPIAIRRMKALGKAGEVSIEEDDQGRPRFCSITFKQEILVESIRRIENLYRLVENGRAQHSPSTVILSANMTCRASSMPSATSLSVGGGKNEGLLLVLIPAVPVLLAASRSCCGRKRASLICRQNVRLGIWSATSTARPSP